MRFEHFHNKNCLLTFSNNKFLVGQAEELEYNVYYWRNQNDEVDYIVASDSVCLAIEVKSGRRGMNSGLPKFESQFHPTRAFIVGTNGISLEDFLSCNLSELLNP